MPTVILYAQSQKNTQVCKECRTGEGEGVVQQDNIEITILTKNWLFSTI